MVDVVQNNLDKIINTCRQHYVQTLYLFGSAARENDFTENSDLDFLVCFETLPANTLDDIQFLVNNYDSLQEKLEDITNRKVDLIKEENIKNRFLKYFINKDRLLIYGLS